ncbi:STAS domain-containing protein, partial [Streptomyces sp. SID2955]|nr:STAS domain-containing protein [Streptomyces sp. SID2955]
MSPLKITARDAATGPVLEIFGELDFFTAGELRELIPTIALQPGQRLVLDLSGMEFCDSSGLSALIAAHNHAHAAQAD